MTAKIISALPPKNPAYANVATKGGYMLPGSIGYRIVGLLAKKPKGMTTAAIARKLTTVKRVSIRCVSAMAYNRGFLRVVGYSGRSPVYGLNIPRARAVAA